MANAKNFDASNQIRSGGCASVVKYLAFLAENKSDASQRIDGGGRWRGGMRAAATRFGGRGVWEALGGERVADVLFSRSRPWRPMRVPFAVPSLGSMRVCGWPLYRLIPVTLSPRRDGHRSDRGSDRAPGCQGLADSLGDHSITCLCMWTSRAMCPECLSSAVSTATCTLRQKKACNLDAVNCWRGGVQVQVAQRRPSGRASLQMRAAACSRGPARCP